MIREEGRDENAQTDEMHRSNHRYLSRRCATSFEVLHSALQQPDVFLELLVLLQLLHQSLLVILFCTLQSNIK